MPDGAGVTGSGAEAVEPGTTPVSGILSVIAEKPGPSSLKYVLTLNFHGPVVAGPERPGPAVLVSMDKGTVMFMPSLKMATGAVPTSVKALQSWLVTLKMEPVLFANPEPNVIT